MHQKNKTITSIGIIIPTMNRPDFIIRQLEYYASLNSPHSVYIADSSDSQMASRIKAKVDELKNKINILYYPYPPGDVVKCVIFLLSEVKEKYVCSIGDDDFRVPGSLTACAEFLEDNNDYQSAIGQSVSVRIADNKAHGEITSIHDYPRYPIESDKASSRLIEFMGPHISSVIASVIKTENLLRYYRIAWQYKDDNYRGEIIPSCLMLINGKHKVIDKLDLVRQIHGSHFKIEDVFDQITGNNWPETYSESKKDLISALIQKDGIGQDDGEKTIKAAFWGYLEYLLSRFYKNYMASINPPGPKRVKLKTKLASALPILKNIYKKMYPLLGKKGPRHSEVLRPGSKYYNDFKQISLSINRN